MLNFKNISWCNFLSSGDTPIEIKLDTQSSTLIVGMNGSGKCLRKNTKVDVKFSDPDVEKLFKKMLKDNLS
jgi:predicted ATP-binding protein involved in virulence